MQVLTRQISPPGQSACDRHATQWPMPSHSVPPLSEHEVPGAAGAVVQAFDTQAGDAQDVVVSGQSVARRQATQLPAPSQRVPPLLVQASPAATTLVAQQPATHTPTTQSLDGAGQSLTTVQAAAPPGQAGAPAALEAGVPPSTLVGLVVALPPSPLPCRPPLPAPDPDPTNSKPPTMFPHAAAIGIAAPSSARRIDVRAIRTSPSRPPTRRRRSARS
jgi:hypothetical protein